MLKRLLFIVLTVSLVPAAGEPKRIEADIANQSLLKKVEPIVPPLAKALEIGGTVVLDVTISADGKVSSVKVLSGHPMLVPAYVEAVKKWEYKPFMEGGHSVPVVTRVE